MLVRVIQKDILQIYMGEELHVGKIALRQPSLREIISIGEESFFGTIHALAATPSDCKSFLWDNGLDWTQVSRLEFFYTMTRSLTVEQTSVLFGDLDLTAFVLYQREDGDPVMYNQSQDITIDLYAYSHICDYLCKAYHLKQLDVKPGTEFTKRMMIDMDREERARKKNKPFKSALYDLISALVNHPAFKYNIAGVMELTYFQFMDSVRRVQRVHASTVIGAGFYSNVDFKKFDTKTLDWMRPIAL